ncbi:hypothetical protein [Streptomyces sp. NRRL B-24572]|uniref:hypothetical protein n=1 Tax=Streptomyces sp. NRRL B-24572 TaxID=1962156 RepID=UPI000A3C6D88|nr:hypothetical protein [Streptomyces sp. NRRL B-24572]
MAGLVAVALLSTAAPSNAAGHRSYGNNTGRCNATVLGGGNWQPLCLFYVHDGSGAIWGQDGSVYDLRDHHFISGTGTGSGQYVKNNATAMESEYWEGSGGTVWFNSGYQGNYDFAYDGQGGPLYYTWNENASTEVGIGVG